MLGRIDASDSDRMLPISVSYWYALLLLFLKDPFIHKSCCRHFESRWKDAIGVVGRGLCGFGGRSDVLGRLAGVGLEAEDSRTRPSCPAVLDEPDEEPVAEVSASAQSKLN